MEEVLREQRGRAFQTGRNKKRHEADKPSQQPEVLESEMRAKETDLWECLPPE